jgi:hypothetical protein
MHRSGVGAAALTVHPLTRAAFTRPLSLGFILDFDLMRLEINLHVNGVGSAADLAVFLVHLVLAGGNVHEDLIDLKAPGAIKRLSHGALPFLPGV